MHWSSCGALNPWALPWWRVAARRPASPPSITAWPSFSFRVRSAVAGWAAWPWSSSSIVLQDAGKSPSICGIRSRSHSGGAWSLTTPRVVFRSVFSMEKSDRFSSRASRVPRSRPDLRLARALGIAAILTVTMKDGYAGAPRPSGSLVPTRSEVIATQGMAATSHPLVSQVALDVLKRGGTAVDAAIAANATMGLMEPTGNGVGGDLFAIVWDAKTRKLYGLNGSGRSPRSLTLEEFQHRSLKYIPSRGPLCV